MRNLKIAFALAVGAGTPCAAFDVHTHAVMTMEAVAQSEFSRNAEASARMKGLGLHDPAVWGSTSYVDIGPSNVLRGGHVAHEDVFAALRTSATLPNPLPGTYSATGWLMQGAIREDDNTIETPGSDEPGGAFDRPFGHFFDPQRDRGMRGPPGYSGPRSVDWALQREASIGFSARQNHFKIADAREAMWRALTMTATSFSGGFNTNVWPTNSSTLSQESLRQAYWATTFRALGNVIHLVQDLGQPQHTRNDLHSGLGCLAGIGACLGGHASFFEHYLKGRTLGVGRFTLSEGFREINPDVVNPEDIHRTNASQLNYSGYPKPIFNSYADFFYTQENATGKGLANFSNRGFYSFGTNIYSAAALNDYPMPNPSGQGLTSEVLSGPAFKDMTGRDLPGNLTLLTGTVTDTVVPGMTESGVRLSSVGIWDQFLQQRNQSGSYTLNYYNYNDQADMLVPRAVAYSAGLLDYFFRGQLEIALPDSGVYAIVDHAAFAGSGIPSTDVNGYKGFSKIRLKLRNATPVINTPGGGAYPQGMGAGTLVAVAKFHRNLNYRDDLSGEKGGSPFDPATFRSDSEEIVISQFQSVPSVPDTLQEYEFTFPQEIPINATDLYLQVVFRGALGQEADAVVVATRDISEPTYFALMNSMDYKLTPDGHTYHCTAETHCNGGAMGAALAFYRDGITGPIGASVSTHGLAVGSFIRFAFLTDPQPELQFVYNFEVQNRWPPDAWSYSPAQNQLNSVPILVTRQRQIYNTNYKAILNQPDGQPTAVRPLDPDELDQPLQYPHPQPIECLSVLPNGCVNPS